MSAMDCILYSIADTALFGRTFGSLLKGGDVVALIGDLGSGKTTLAQAIAQGLDVAGPVTSPTFSLIQEYSGRVPVYHIDPYRLVRPEEISELGLDDYLHKDGVVVVEWADLIENLLPVERLEIWLEILNPDIGMQEPENLPRSLTIEGHGPSCIETVSRLANHPDLACLLSGASPHIAGRSDHGP